MRLRNEDVEYTVKKIYRKLWIYKESLSRNPDIQRSGFCII